MQKSKTKTLNNSILSNTLKGLIVGSISFISLLAVFSLVILRADINNSLYFIFILISAGISVFTGSFFSAATAKKYRLINGLLTSIIQLIMEFILLLCFNNAALSIKIYLMVPTAIILGIIGGITGSNIRKK